MKFKLPHKISKRSIIINNKPVTCYRCAGAFISFLLPYNQF
jgi:hypothetical protein